MKCTNCGREIGAGAVFCTGCGMKVSDMNVSDMKAADMKSADMTAGAGESMQSQQTAQSQQYGQQQAAQSQSEQYGQQQAQQAQSQSAQNQRFNGNNYGYNPNPSMNMGYNPNMGMGMAVNQAPAYNTYVDNNGKRVPVEYKPIKAWGYFGYNILFAIPLVGFIFLLVYALGGTSNINLKNYARSFFCVFILSLIILLVVFVLAMMFGISDSYL